MHKPLEKKLIESIQADWRTGAYSQQKLADKYHVSKGAVNKLCKNLEQDVTDLVTAGITYKTGLAVHSDRLVNAITQIVDERSHHVTFFNQTQIRLARLADAKVDETSELTAIKVATDIVSTNRNDILPKQNTAQITNLQVNNTVQLSQEQLLERANQVHEYITAINSN